MRAEALERRWTGYAVSVLPALVGWASLLIPVRLGLGLQAATFVALLAYDLWTVRAGYAPSWYASLRRQLTAAAVLLLGGAAIEPPSAAAQPANRTEIVCDLTSVLAGRMEGRTLRTDGLVTGAASMRLTFRSHDAGAGRAMLRIDDEPDEHPVGMTVDRSAIVYLEEEPGIGKLLISTSRVPSPDGWPAVLSQHGWEGGTLTVRVMVGACRARSP